ncbi:MAG TPA: DUF503 domain-containing protein [Actinomycetales bacterium]|nr:DUF503 domain-containing protein [Actinomycetales bacterium]
MFVGLGRFDILLGPLGSLKAKRSTVRRITAELQQKYGCAVAESDYQELLHRAEVSVAVVSSEYGHCQQMLENCERFLAAKPEHELLAARLRVISDEDV